MDDHLSFQMGLYKATFPRELQYSETHFWLQSHENRTKIGLTSYANRLLSELFRIDWNIALGTLLQKDSLLGEIESTKATSELYSPMTGRLLAMNSDVLEEPSLISTDPYQVWLLEFEGIPQDSLSTEQYIAMLTDGWEETVQLLKGQV
jgi:glycine cleavage system H protein